MTPTFQASLISTFGECKLSVLCEDYQLTFVKTSMMSIFQYIFSVFREKICCGTIFVGPDSSIIIDKRLLIPCERRLRGGKCAALPSASQGRPQDSKAPAQGKTGQFSDNSSDSGYDESSNSSAELTSSRLQASAVPIQAPN